MADIHIGTRMFLHPTHRPGRDRVMAEVVYIHPLGRFITVEFETKAGNFRESFILTRSGNVSP